MAAKPLTDEEKRQRDELNELILGPGNGYIWIWFLAGLISWFSEPLELMDDDLADDIIAWSEGRGKSPDNGESWG